MYNGDFNLFVISSELALLPIICKNFFPLVFNGSKVEDVAFFHNESERMPMTLRKGDSGRLNDFSAFI